jgi:hypothetical protein
MRRMLIAALAVISAAALVSGAGLALAKPSPDRSASSATEDFRVISTVAKSDRQSVIATGAFVAGGVYVLGSTRDKAELYRGTFMIYRHVTYKSTPQPPVNCLFTETERGTYTIGAGTGRYARISGSGKFTLRITGVLASTGKGQCGGMVAFQQIMSESGRVRV